MCSLPNLPTCCNIFFILQSNSTTDYINAVFVDGFCQERAMIATEWPLMSTVANFWSMVYDHDCSAIIVLNDPPTPGKVRTNKSWVRFWPEEGQANYGPVFSTQAVGTTTNRDFTTFHLRLGKKEIAPHRYWGYWLLWELVIVGTGYCGYWLL
jgi:protein tyrosine phosphatase